LHPQECKSALLQFGHLLMAESILAYRNALCRRIGSSNRYNGRYEAETTANGIVSEPNVRSLFPLFAARAVNLHNIQIRNGYSAPLQPSAKPGNSTYFH